VVCNRELIREKALRFQDKFRRALVPVDAPGAFHRGADRFALVAFAGELATYAGITGWKKNEASRAAHRLFAEWLATQGDARSPDHLETAMGRLRRLLVDGAERFTPVAECGMDIADRAGFIRIDRKTGNREFWLLPQVFQDELCEGASPRLVARALERRGHLLR
jgi:putative DNA primase/helicase